MEKKERYQSVSPEKKKKVPPNKKRSPISMTEPNIERSWEMVIGG
jgi:hypothetical protein